MYLITEVYGNARYCASSYVIMVPTSQELIDSVIARNDQGESHYFMSCLI